MLTTLLSSPLWLDLWKCEDFTNCNVKIDNASPNIKSVAKDFWSSSTEKHFGNINQNPRKQYKHQDDWYCKIFGFESYLLLAQKGASNDSSQTSALPFDAFSPSSSIESLIYSLRAKRSHSVKDGSSRSCTKYILLGQCFQRHEMPFC